MTPSPYQILKAACEEIRAVGCSCGQFQCASCKARVALDAAAKARLADNERLEQFLAERVFDLKAKQPSDGYTARHIAKYVLRAIDSYERGTK